MQQQIMRNHAQSIFLFFIFYQHEPLTLDRMTILLCIGAVHFMMSIIVHERGISDVPSEDCQADDFPKHEIFEVAGSDLT